MHYNHNYPLSKNTCYINQLLINVTRTTLTLLELTGILENQNQLNTNTSHIYHDL